MANNNRRITGLEVGQAIDNEYFALNSYERDYSVRLDELKTLPVGSKEAIFSGVRHKGGMPDGDRYRAKVTFKKIAAHLWQVIEKAEVAA